MCMPYLPTYLPTYLLTYLPTSFPSFPFILVLHSPSHPSLPSLPPSLHPSLPPSPSGHWSPLFRDFLSRFLRKDPASRPSCSSLLLHPWLEQARTQHHNGGCVTTGTSLPPSLPPFLPPSLPPSLCTIMTAPPEWLTKNSAPFSPSLPPSLPQSLSMTTTAPPEKQRPRKN